MHNTAQLNSALLNQLAMNSPYVMPTTGYQQTIFTQSQFSFPPRTSFISRQYANQNQIPKKRPQHLSDSPSFHPSPLAPIHYMDTELQSPVTKIRTKSQTFSLRSDKDTLEGQCAKFLKETSVFEFMRLHPCFSCNTSLKYNIKYLSKQFESNVIYRSDNCISTAFRCVKQFFCSYKSQPEGISFEHEALRIEVYDGKGTVYFNDQLLGQFRRKSPSIFCKTFCNQFIDLIITPKDEEYFYELKKNTDCLNGCCECFLTNNIPCCGNEADILLLKNKTDVISSSTMSRSDCYHLQTCIGLSCFKGKWDEVKIDLNNPGISFREKCLLLGAWFYYIEYCQ
ncbi:hypothetical protein TTHERM_00312600 (macronuclear) [Tetrahymena thermophila SB210]|uniref:Phospholipid scramblase n=1 Tax=Tetrahymena thermophila (strain SB210) TaxID=312017 RepID=Q22KM1_TETTS|nr:hypothetical protein TTHERM_00312600 [Tetrahymena thermophila SB210]EAR85778.1 hypothetical protein TTHERM_00312600 [Tetrahymena thermophila SB210]|eukprot:XP_001033441.1 hypothetical protein TTHERM_00312600 [Tetrahymena thermophila SB210]